MRKPTGKPNGRPRALTADQASRVYESIKATKHGRRWKVYSALASELRVSVPTLQRAVTRASRQQLADIAAKFHQSHQNSPAGETA